MNEILQISTPAGDKTMKISRTKELEVYADNGGGLTKWVNK